MRDPLHDARKAACSNGGALLQWGWDHPVPPAHSLQMPEDVVDAILEDRKLRRRIAELEAEVAGLRSRRQAHDRWLLELDEMGLSASYDIQMERINIDYPKAFICMDNRLWKIERAGGSITGCTFAAFVAALKEIERPHGGEGN